MSEPTPEQRAEELYFEADVRDGKERWVRVVAAAIRAATAASEQARQQAEAERDRLAKTIAIKDQAIERYLPCPDCRDKVLAGECQRCARQRAEAKLDAARAGLERMRRALIGLQEAMANEPSFAVLERADKAATEALADPDASAYAAWVDGLVRDATEADEMIGELEDFTFDEHPSLYKRCKGLRERLRAALAARPGA